MHMDLEFSYKDEKSDVFGNIKRPRIEIEIFSSKKDRWVWLDEVLVDTGADFCVLPRFLGNILVKDITKGRYVEIKGVVPGVKLIAYLHTQRIKLGELEFIAPVAIADSDDVPAIFGRIKSLDLFDADFLKGKIVKLS